MHCLCLSSSIFPQSALNTALDMEELPHWFDTGRFTVTQLIPEHKLSSRSMETSFNSDTISYHQSTRTMWGVVHSMWNYMNLKRLATAYAFAHKQKQQEIIIRRCADDSHIIINDVQQGMAYKEKQSVLCANAA